MGLISWFKERIKMLFKTDAEKAFGVETYLSPEMDAAIKLWGQLESGKPPWLKESNGRTVAFWNTIAEELAKLITQNIDVKVQGIRPGDMPEKMQEIIDKYFMKEIKNNIHAMVFFGGIMVKWGGRGGNGLEFIRPDRFLVTDYDSNGEIDGVIFLFSYTKEKITYTRAEWHRFEEISIQSENGQYKKEYRVSNKAFKSDNPNELGREIPLSQTKWADVSPEFWTEKLQNPLFLYIKCPNYNYIDSYSPLGVSCFANCMEEFRMLDIAMSTLEKETKNSSPMMMVSQSMIQYANNNGIDLPEFFLDAGMDDLGNGSPIEQWQPQLQVASRKEGINFCLSIIGFKCGFDPGYFVFDGQDIQMATATQVRVTQKRTADTALSYRDVLDRPNSNGEGRVGAIHDIAYIINAMLVINGNVPRSDNGNYKLFCSFADLLKNEEEDAMLDKQLADTGYIPKWKWLVLHRGYTEEEAKMLVAEAQMESMGNNQGGLFDDDMYMPLQKEESSQSRISQEESAGKGLNGAQTQSLITIISQLSAGTITEGQAINLIATAIGISKEDARKILAGEI